MDNSPWQFCSIATSKKGFIYTKHFLQILNSSFLSQCKECVISRGRTAGSQPDSRHAPVTPYLARVKCPIYSLAALSSSRRIYSLTRNRQQGATFLPDRTFRSDRTPITGRPLPPPSVIPSHPAVSSGHGAASSVPRWPQWRGRWAQSSGVPLEPWSASSFHFRVWYKVRLVL